MIAIIAGTGTLPLQACDIFLREQKRFFVLALFPEDNGNELRKRVEDEADVIALPFYKAEAILDTLKQQETTHVLFIGKVDKRNAFKKFKFDWLFFKLATKILYKSDKAIMELIIETLAQHGIETLSQHEILGDLTISPGILTGSLSKEQEHDVMMGINLAQTISRHDIGQTVVVKDGMILAVEAIEGTDNCIKRGINQGKGNVVVCKAARPDQNKKFDLPTLGPQSLQGITKGEIAVIAWRSRQTLIAQVQEFIAQAEALGITLVSVDESCA